MNSRHFHHRRHGIALAVIAVLDAPLLAHALPQGGQVVEGQVTIGAPAAGQVGLTQNITQGSARAVVDWRSFGIGANERVSLAQPAGGAALFRVTGSDPSQILGSLSTTGALFLSNPNGVLFGAGARVDVGSLAATTLGITNSDFMAARLRFAGDSRASVVNEGRIDAGTSGSGGSVVLLGASVANSGTINAPQGSVALGAGSAATIDVYGNGLLKLNLTDGADGAAVNHSGTVQADGGVVNLATLCRPGGAPAAINVTGLVRAQSLTARDGAIFLSGGSGSQVNLSGTLDTSSATAGENAGKDAGRIDVSGERIDVAPSARLLADASGTGHGGTVNAIATDAMTFAGSLSARGGAAGGDGGNAEVSGHGTLTMKGTSDLSAAAGNTGTLLLDPGSIRIIDSAGNENGPNVFGDAQLATLLGTNSLLLSTANATNGAAQTIDIAGGVNVTWGARSLFTLDAGQSITVNSGAVIRNTNAAGPFDAIAMIATAPPATARGTTGITLNAGSVLETTRGNIILRGRGGNAGEANHGVNFKGAAANPVTVRTVDGNINIDGVGGAGSFPYNTSGIRFEFKVNVEATGSGSINLFGTNPDTVAQRIGVLFVAADATVRTTTGNLTVTGRGSLQMPGINFLNSTATLTSTSGNIKLDANSAVPTFVDGLNSTLGSVTLGGAGTSGTITLVADRLVFDDLTARTSGTLSVVTQTSGRQIGVGSADASAQLGLSVAELAALTAGRLEIGNTTAGNLTVSQPIAPSAGTGTLALISGGTIGVNAAISGGAARLSLAGTAGVRLGAVLSSNAANVASTRAIAIRTPGIVDNAVGAGVLSTPGGNWSVSLATPVGHNFNGLLSGNTAVWNNPVTSNVNPTGNRYSFALAPTIFIDAGAATKVYGDALPSTVTLANAPINAIARTFGGVFTDYATGTLGGSYTRSSAGLAATANAGTYTDLTVASVANATTTLNGYAIVAGATGTVGVAPRSVTLLPAVQMRVYGDANPTTGAATGLVNGDTAQLTLSSPATALSPVGIYDLTGSNAVFGVGSASNYAISYAAAAPLLAVTQRPITLTLQGSRSRPYGGGIATNSISTPAVTAGSLAAGDRIASYGYSLNTPALTAPVGTYSVPFTSVELSKVSNNLQAVTANYAITRVDAPYFVTPRPVTLTPVAVSRAYGDANPATAGAASNLGVGVGLVNGDAVSQLSITSPANATSNVGSQPSTGSNAVFSRGAASNYTITYGTNPAGLVVTPRALTLTPDAVSRAYGDTNPATAGAASNSGPSVGLVNGDTVSQVGITSPAGATSNVGSYLSTGSNAVFSSGAASNYAISYGSNAAGLVVTPRALTVTPAAVSRVYGDANPARGTATLSAGTLAGTDAITDVALASPATAGSFVGTYALSASNAVFASGSAGNYAISYTDRGNGLTVTPRPVTLTLQGSYSRPYGGGIPVDAINTPTATTGSLVAGDVIVIYFYNPGDVALNAPVGTYALSFRDVGLQNGIGQIVDANYAITRADAPLFVTPRPMTLTPLAVSRAYGDANPATAGATSNSGPSVGLVNGDTVAQLGITSPAGATSNVGSYLSTGSNAVFSSGAASNYAISYGSNAAGLVVTPRALTVAPAAASRVYGDANPARGTATLSAGTLAGTDALTDVALASPATAGSFVGTYALSASNAVFASGSAGNYLITYGSLGNGLTITQRPITLTLRGTASRPYGGGTTIINIGEPLLTAGRLAAGDQIAGFNYNYGDPSPTAPVGTYAVSLRVLSLTDRAGQSVSANYAITSVNAPFFVTPRPVTLTPVAVSRAYGDANPATAGAASNSGPGVGLVNGDTVSLSITSPAGAASNVGSYLSTGSNAVFSSGAATNYAIGYGSNAAGLVVTPRALTVTPVAVGRVYGGANPATAGATGNNLVNGDTLGSLAISSGASAASNVGAYPTSGGNATFTTGLASNYTLSYADNATGLAVTPRALTLGPDAVSRVYGDPNPARGTAAVVAGNLVNGDTVADVALTTSATVASFVGSYPLSATSAAFSSGSASNYAILFAARGNGLTVTQRAVTLSSSGISTRPYGGGLAVNGGGVFPVVTAGSLAAGDTVFSAAFSGATPALSAPVGDFAVPLLSAGLRNTASVDVTANYALTLEGFTFRVTPRPVTLTPVQASRAYGDANPATATVTSNSGFGIGLVNGDTVSQVALITAATTASNAGLYPTFGGNAVFTTGAASNYTITYGTNATGLNVTPRPLTVTPVAGTRTYGDANPATAGATGNNLVNGDTLAGVSITSPATPATDVGTYPTDAGNALFASGLAGNYAIGYAQNASGLAVTPRPITLAASPVTRFYGDPTAATGAGVPTLGTIVNGDTVASVSLSTPALATSPVGGYDLGAGNAAFSAGSAANYAISYVTSTVGLLIVPRPVTLTPDAVTRIYGDANPVSGGASVTAGNLVNGDTLGTVALASPATLASGVGSYRLDGANPLFTVGTAGNYAISIAPLASGLTVTPRTLTVTPDAVTRQYGDANPATAGANGNNLVNGDTLAGVSITSPATPATPVGTYDTRAANALFGSGNAGNYTIGYATNPAGLDVMPRPLTLTPVAATRLYGDANPTLGTATANAGGLVNGDSVVSVDLASSATLASHVGVYDSTAANAVFGSGLAGNYAIGYAVNPLGLAVNARPLLVTPDAVSRTYGDPTPASAGASGNNLVNGDALAGVSIASSATLGSATGSHPTSASNVLFATGLATDYTISYADNAIGLAITPRPLTLTPDALARSYGDANPARGTASGSAAGLVNGDTVASVALASPAVVNSGVGRYELTAADALFGQGSATNYLLSYAPLPNGLLVTPRGVDVAALAGQAKVAGRPDPLFGYAVTGGSLVAGDAFTGSLSRAPGEALGNYPILQGTLTLGPNYSLGYTGAPFTVASTGALAVVDRNPATGAAATSGAVAGDVLASLPSPAAGPATDEALVPPCVRESSLGGSAADARLVNRGMRLPAGVVDACRPAGGPPGS